MKVIAQNRSVGVARINLSTGKVDEQQNKSLDEMLPAARPRRLSDASSPRQSEESPRAAVANDLYSAESMDMRLFISTTDECSGEWALEPRFATGYCYKVSR